MQILASSPKIYRRITQACLAFASAASSALANAPELLDVFSPGLPQLSGNYSVAVSTNYTPSGSAWTVPYSESLVHLATITYEQRNSSNEVMPARSFRLRIGQGGQIYSLRSAFGEAIPPQYREPSPEDNIPDHYAPWVDEVFQSTGVNTNANTEANPYFIHQAGVYLNEPGMSPFYSPVLAKSTLSDGFATVNWSQQAHVPSVHKSGLITYTRYRAIGSGIIEVTYLFHNFGTDTINRFNVPWGGVRRTSLPLIELGTAGVPASIPLWSAGAGGSANSIGGWLLYFRELTSNNPQSLALVFGRDPSVRESWNYNETRFRYGYAGGPVGTTETNWRNYLVTSMTRLAHLNPGESLEARIFYVLGGRDTVKNVISSTNHPGGTSLLDYAVIQKRSFATASTPTITWYRDAQGQATTTPVPGVAPMIVTFSKPVAGKRPVFWVRNNLTGLNSWTQDPYAGTLGYENGATVYRPYNGAVTYLGLLGYF